MLRPLAAAAALLLLLVGPLARAAKDDNSEGPTDAEMLLAWKDTFENGDDVLESWEGSNPCDGWVGVNCTSGHITRM